MSSTGTMRLVSSACVNSKWVARWLSKKDQEACECPVDCKVTIVIERNGHSPYRYVVSSKEFRRLKKELTFLPTTQ